MKLEMKKFGKILNGRPAGREAVLRMHQIVNGFRDDGEIVLDFTEVDLFTPSFADEFIRGIKGAYPNKKISAEGAKDNPAIQEVFDKALEGDNISNVCCPFCNQVCHSGQIFKDLKCESCGKSLKIEITEENGVIYFKIPIEFLGGRRMP